MVFDGGGGCDYGSTDASETTDFNLVKLNKGAGCVEEDETDCRREVVWVESAVVSYQVVACSWEAIAFRWLREFGAKLK